MNNVIDTPRTRTSKLGWGLHLLISALLVLNGIAWLGVGPRTTLAYPLRLEGISEEVFTQDYPAVVDHIAVNARELAVWYIAFGLLAFLVALEGFRRGSRWAWVASWVVVGAFIVAGINYWIGLPAGFANVGRIGIGVLLLVGQFLARTSLAKPSD